MPASAETRRTEPWRRRLYLPAYTVKDSARYAGISPRTVANWHRQSGVRGPLLPGKEPREALSYLQLIELAVVAAFRHSGVSLQRIRKTQEYASQVLQVEYPFATLRFKTEGINVVLALQEIEPDAKNDDLIIVSGNGQMTWQAMLGDRFNQFDYEDDLAVVWHVAGRTSSVVIDPRVSFGAPMVRGIPTWAIKGRHVAGESLEDISEDFGLEVQYILDALRFEQALEAA